MRTRNVIVAAGLATVIGATSISFLEGKPLWFPATAVPSDVAASLPSHPVPEITIAGTSFLSWALLDRRTDTLIGSANIAATSDTMSLIKVWLAADHLATIDIDPAPARLRQLRAMIVDSDNAVASLLYRRNGRAATIQRMIMRCGLTDSAPGSRWSTTLVSARDVARLGSCIVDGRAAGPKWTEWLLDRMREVRGAGDFGPRWIYPQPRRQTIAIKNGWILRDEDGLWHISCLAIGDTWSLGVLIRYPGGRGKSFGESTCQKVGAAILPR